jgi:hypothetical protein
MLACYPSKWRTDVKKHTLVISLTVVAVVVLYMVLAYKDKIENKFSPSSEGLTYYEVPQQASSSQLETQSNSLRASDGSIRQPELSDEYAKLNLPDGTQPAADHINYTGHADIRTLSPSELYELVDSGQALHDLSTEAFIKLANRLSQLAREGDPWAGDALASLTMGVADNQERHILMQMLGRSGSETAAPILLDILHDNLDNPIEVNRISSYLPLIDGKMATEVVDALFAMAQLPDLPPEVTKSILGNIFYKGGEYGQQLIVENEMIPLMR